jgi:eukaryotic-like serine/threonine-protein kinase
VTTTSNPFKSDNVLGYKIVERLGAGGYGEVWKAEAPGGLLKAVKILYGFHDEKKAQVELKALDKIKQLRHPFLLSLERIEVVDDHLIVITELADKSLADLYNEHAAKGAIGIPREDLIQFLSQAAEALDFLSLEHGLQHLDIKPENILLVGRHAKLADFGLVKSLQDVTQSLMNGLTPAYASPELFDGRPSLFSDQYSLAMVYYEMLTGERCFDGKTPAQLAAQHMNARPNLSRIIKSDHPAMLRALSKNPELRYKSCMDFVNDLNHQRSLHREKKRNFSSARIRTKDDTDSTDLKLIARAQTNDQTIVLSENAFGIKRTKSELVDAPEYRELADELTPTLILGVGATASRILQRVKQKMNSSLPTSNIPAVQILCLDSDRNCIASAVGEGTGESLAYHEGLALPLRKPEDYRNRSKYHSNWLNRRWIYNVPKSLQTEGIRPLGRLALIDNYEEFWNCLEDKSSKLVSTEAIAASAESIGKEFKKGTIRVFIVSSISGGIGSGMTLDLAYSVKLLLNQVGLPTDCVNGILIHGSNSRECDPGISMANSMAFLTELRHYTQYGYPGENSVGIPPIQDEFPIDNPYFLNFGENLSASEWDDHVDQVAEYIFANTFTRAGSFFDSCRELNGELDSFKLRSFGVSSNGITLENSARLKLAVTKAIVQRWLGEKDPHPDSLHSASVALSVLPFDSVNQQIENNLESNIPLSVIDSVLDSIGALEATAPADAIDAVQKLRVFYPKRIAEHEHSTSIMSAKKVSLPEILVQDAASELEAFRQIVSTQFQKTFQSQRFSYKSFRIISRAFLDKLKEIMDRSAAEANELLAVADRLENSILAAVNSPKSKQHRGVVLRDLFSQFASALRNSVQREAIGFACRVLTRHVNSEIESVERSRIQLASNGRNSLAEIPLSVIENRTFGIDRLIIHQIIEGFDEIVNATELRFYHNCVSPLGSFREIMVNDSINLNSLFEDIGRFAQQEIVSFGKNLNIDKLLIDAAAVDNNAVAHQIDILIEKSKPMLDECGGAARLLVALPESAPTLMVADSISRSARVKVGAERLTCGNLVIIGETENVDLATVASRLLEKRADCQDLAKRLHTRNDVVWSTLDDLL